MNEVKVIHDGAWDWEILVINGEKVSEGHSLSLYDWEHAFAKLGIPFSVEEVEDIQESEYYGK